MLEQKDLKLEGTFSSLISHDNCLSLLFFVTLFKDSIAAKYKDVLGSLELQPNKVARQEPPEGRFQGRRNLRRRELATQVTEAAACS